MIEKESSNETSNIENESSTKPKSSFSQFFHNKSESKSKEELTNNSSNNSINKKSSASLKKVNQNPFKFLQNLFKRTTDSNDSNHNSDNGQTNKLNADDLDLNIHKKEVLTTTTTDGNHVHFKDSILNSNGATSHHSIDTK